MKVASWRGTLTRFGVCGLATTLNEKKRDFLPRKSPAPRAANLSQRLLENHSSAYARGFESHESDIASPEEAAGSSLGFKSNFAAT